VFVAAGTAVSVAAAAAFVFVAVRVFDAVRVSVAVYVGTDGSHVAVAVLVAVFVAVKAGANDENVALVVSTAPLMSAPTSPVKLLDPSETTPVPSGAILMISTDTVQLSSAASVTPEIVTSLATLVSTVPPQVLVTAPSFVPAGAVKV
jgi:hypothetical protein